MPRYPKSPRLDSLLAVLAEIPDPRVARTRVHPLVNVLTMALFGTICGADGWEALETFAKERAEFFETFLDLEGGTPSADTFRRVFEALDPQAFQEAFRRWLKPFLDDLQGQTIAMDGKTLRGALARSAGSGGAFHLMHLWATEQRLLLGQKAVDGAGGEVQAALELLQLLDLRGATITADANSCTAGVTAAVRDAGADFVLALKGNRSAPHKHVQQRFADAAKRNFRGVKQYRSRDEAHGRVEYRWVRAMPIGDLPPRIRAPWTDLRTIVLVERVRAANSLSVETSYYVTSHNAQPKLLAQRIRDHWKIENQLHHCLDVSFAEDNRRIHHENGAQNFALIARHALSMIKREPSAMSVAMKRRRAAWSPTYVFDVLATGFSDV